MHLRSMTLKGFKSFAAATTLQFEPGVTCVVGPNGSGKSNVVDALSWVMGEQGAKSLRGGKMEDVIFAGTSTRAPLGRAEVTLTIDNCDGALPIDYTEVTISRIMFRSGGSEYAINGNPCRLLDVQELLSDSGIGREMHVIVGQGQLDSILHATPEDRRGFIEEAAGVLKHRKRKEKTLRKLDGLTDKMTRLADLTGELRRQLKPLGRQAEVARRAVVIQSDARDARLRLLADDLAVLQQTLAQDQADEAALREQRSDAESRLLAAQAREAELTLEAQEASPELTRNQDLWFRLSGLTERFRAVASVARERTQNLAESQQTRAPSTDPNRLEQQARDLRNEHASLATAVREQAQELTARSAARVAAETALADEERRVEQAQRSAAEQRERRATKQGQVAMIASRHEARQVSITGLETHLAEADRRTDDAATGFAELERTVTGLGEGEADLDTRFERCRAAVEEADANLRELTGREAALGTERAALRARLEGLRSAVGSRAQLGPEILQHRSVIGLVRDQLRITPGWEQAVAAALGDLTEAAVVESLDAALALVTENPDLIGARLMIAGGGTDGTRPLPDSLAGHVTCPDPLRPVMLRVLGKYRAVPDLTAARAAVSEEGAGNRAAITRDGHIIASDRLVLWGDQPTSTLELAAQIEDMEERDRRCAAEADRVRFAIDQGRGVLTDRTAEQEEALAALHESDAAMAAVADQLGAFATAMRAARHEGDRIRADLESARSALADDATALRDAREALDREQRHMVAEHVDGREPLAEQVARTRSAEVEIRLALRTGEERAAGVLRRSQELHAAAQSQREAQAAAERTRRQRARQREVALAVRTAATRAGERAAMLASAADALRSAGERARAARDGELAGLRGTVQELSQTLDDLTNSVHRDEMVRTEQRLKIEQIQSKAMEDFGIDPDGLIADYGPQVPVPPSARAPGDEEDGGPIPQPYPFERGQQERRMKAAERSLALLGRVNPLALEEFAALEERHQFLSAQLDDLKRSRDDLLGIIKEVDDRMEQVFADAFADTAVQFERVFARLFPGGAGRLVLTEPGDMLASGVEVEARPPGKKVKRLSLLSGGERALTAVAFLVALFKARPSPFYVLDEVEAALDDTNLGRLLEVIDELRADSQLIVITHQKRTMQAGDALYGVTMRDDGVSAVISQRLREPAPV